MTDEELQALMSSEDVDVPGSGVPSQDFEMQGAQAPTEDSGQGYDGTPTQTMPTAAPPLGQPSGIPTSDDILMQLGRQNIYNRLTAPPPNPQALQDAQMRGNIGGLIQQLGGGIAGAVGTPSGGKMDPGAYLAALQGHQAQAYNQTQQNVENAQNQPVQQYMQRQAQQQLAAKQQQGAAEDAIKYGNMSRALANEESLADYRKAQIAQKTGQGTFTDAQVEQSKKTVNALYKLRNGEDAPSELLDTVTPGNEKPVLQAVDKDAVAKARLKQIDAQLASRNVSAAQRQQLQQERLAVSQDRLSLAKSKFGVTLAQGVVPGVQLNQPVSQTVSKSLQQRIPQTQEAIRALGEISDLSKQSGLMAAAPFGQAAGKLKAQFGLVVPKIVAAEYSGGSGGSTFTEGHRKNVMSMLDDPTKLKAAIANGTFQAEIGAIQKGLQDSLNL